MADYKDITTSYSRQFGRPDDARREAEEANRKADLEEVIAGGPVENEGMASYADAFDAEMEKHGVEDASVNGAQAVNDAIAQAVQAAGARAEALSRTPEQRMAKAIAAELRGQVLETGDGDLYVPTEDDIDHDAELAAYLEAPDEDQVVGIDVDGRTIFQDGNGEQYVLSDDAA